MFVALNAFYMHASRKAQQIHKSEILTLHVFSKNAQRMDTCTLKFAVLAPHTFHMLKL